ncbi:hypothetical protein Moror_9389 [Moniliophthora roreri MCA 2997]|uniref:Uncharacterized protein n=1 Tax=Moniliophthora roreri (strain MCA 2997) TaxID=1381753 RepID=V2WGS3_MONRO|nr:hypothetical protein Moror_9389 [Moniliophthora roreri MCA 2997]
MSFSHSSSFSFRDDNTFNHIHGHQVNGPVTAGIVNFNNQVMVERTEYDEFEYVKRGHIVSMKEIYSELSQWDWKWQNGGLTAQHKARKTIYTVELYPDRQSKYTAVLYEGKDAHKAWKKDFKQFSCTRKPGIAQLFGINQSAIPMLIFHHELIPCAHFFKRTIWMNMYIHHLRANMKCGQSQLWMNTANGALFIGPNGPSAPSPLSGADKPIDVPTGVEMLKDDTSFRFFSKFGSSLDGSVLFCAQQTYEIIHLENLFPETAEDCQSKDSDHPDRGSATYPYLRGLWKNPPHHLPMDVIGGLRFDTVYSPSMKAIARWLQGAGSLWWWWGYNRKGLVDETELDVGTRFKLDLTRGQEVRLEANYYGWKLREAWLSQSPRVFDAVDVTEQHENFFIVNSPHLKIQSTQRPTASSTSRNCKHSMKETPLTPTPIYLFLRPLPMSVSELVSWMEGQPYFWSLDETGQSPMSEEECARWGIPVLTLSTQGYVWLLSWPVHIYTAIRDWQNARGFDPATSAWAQSKHYPEFEILGDSGRSKDVVDAREEKQTSTSWWEAFEGSGISAFGF